MITGISWSHGVYLLMTDCIFPARFKYHSQLCYMFCSSHECRRNSHGSLHISGQANHT